MASSSTKVLNAPAILQPSNCLLVPNSFAACGCAKDRKDNLPFDSRSFLTRTFYKRLGNFDGDYEYSYIAGFHQEDNPHEPIISGISINILNSPIVQMPGIMH
jgi:hypothetical protein